MPQNITDNPAFTSPIVAPADGDAANAASVLAGLQGLANRTAFLNNIVGLTGSGITRVRFGAAATMSGLTGMTTGDVFLVNVNGASPTVQGMYVYNASSALTADNAFVYAASGGGQWVHELASFLNVNKGLAAIGPVAGGSATANRLLASVVPNRIFATPVIMNLGADFTTTSTTFVSVTGSSFNIASALAGDIVYADFVANVTNSNAGGWTSVGVGFSENLAGFAEDGTSTGFQTPVGTGIALIAGFCAHTVTTGGTLGINLMAASDNAAHTATVKRADGADWNTALRVWVVRP